MLGAFCGTRLAHLVLNSIGLDNSLFGKHLMPQGDVTWWGYSHTRVREWTIRCCAPDEDDAPEADRPKYRLARKPPPNQPCRATMCATCAPRRSGRGRQHVAEDSRPITGGCGHSVREGIPRRESQS